jgi:hypothetical protein
MGLFKDLAQRIVGKKMPDTLESLQKERDELLRQLALRDEQIAILFDDCNLLMRSSESLMITNQQLQERLIQLNNENKILADAFFVNTNVRDVN